MPNFNLGTTIESAKTAKEAIELANLNFEVDLAKLSARYKEPILDDDMKITSTTLDTHYATYRKDTGDILGVVGSKYHVVQNQDLFDFLDEIVGNGEAAFETAGHWNNGANLFMSVKLPSHITINMEGCKDKIDNYLLISSSHDGSGAIRIAYTPVRVWCRNFLAAAFKKADASFSVKHTINYDEKFKAVKEALKIVNLYQKELEQILPEMAKTKISDNGLIRYISELYLTNEEKALALQKNIPLHKFIYTDDISTRKRGIIDDVIYYSKVGPGQDIITTKGTLFGAYQAVTGYLSNNKNYTSEDKKTASILVGNGSNIIQKSYNLANSILSLSDSLLDEHYNC